MPPVPEHHWLAGTATEVNRRLYVSKPQHVEAVHWTGGNWSEVYDFAPEKVTHGGDGYPLMLHAGKDGAQRWVPVPVGHWLVHPPGDLSDIWPVEDAYFRGKYDRAQ